MSSFERESEPSRARVIGRVVGVWRYPVKSMAAESLQAVELSWNGLAGDRRWAFIREGQERNGFPWQTIRELPAMARYQPRFVDLDKPEASPTRVITPSGADLDVTDPALAAELADGARVIKQARGVFDTLPVSLITTQTLGALGVLLDRELDVQRFRPNLLIETTSESEYPEDSWVGRTVQIGSARVRIDKRDQRCVVVNVDPATGQRDAAVLRAIATEREACLGVYGSIVSPGRAAVGDQVLLVAGDSLVR